MGAYLYIEFEELIITNLFLKSLIASAPGWSSPINPGLFGPNRIWENLKILRSNNVIKATFIKTIIISKVLSK